MRLTRFFAVFLSILAVGFGVFSQFNMGSIETSYIDKQSLMKVEDTNELIAATLQARLEDSVSAMQATALALPLKRVVNNFTENEITQVSSMLKQYGFDRVALCNLRGDVYLNIRDHFNIKDSEGFNRAAAGNVSITYQYYRENDAKKTVVFAAPVMSGDSIYAIIYACWENNELGDILSTSEFRGKEEICLVNRDSSVIYSISNLFEDHQLLLDMWSKKDEQYAMCEQVMKQGRYYSESVISDKGEIYLISYMGIRKLNDWGVALVIKQSDVEAVMNYSRMDFIQYIILGFNCATVLLLCILLLYQSGKRYHLERLAYLDQVTKSYNFKGFLKRITMAFEENPISKFAFVELTIDKFDYYVEMFGNAAMNEVLVYLSSKIAGEIHLEEAYCRYNTLNFVLMLKYENMEELESRLSYLRDKINNERKISNDKFEINAVIGIYCFENKKMSIDTMIYRANLAMEAAMKNRKAPYVFYQESIEDTQSEARQFEEHMYEALDAHEFIAYLLPMFSLKTGKQTGAEALVRWRHPEKGVVYPGRFIPLFEKNGFIVQLDIYILEELCRYLKAWITKGIKPLPLSINVSIYSLYNGEFIEKVTNIVNKYGVPANLICLEIDEKSIIDNIELVQETLGRLKEQGFLISMDDFGVGTISMNTLYQVHIDMLKIDRGFLLNSERTDRGKSIINSIIDISRKLSIEVVGIGVDNKIQAQMLKEFGCDMIQGFVFSEPLPEKEYEEYAYGPRAIENRIAV